MSPVSTLSKFQFGDMTVEYLVDSASQHVGLRISPSALEGRLVEHRATIAPNNARIVCASPPSGRPGLV